MYFFGLFACIVLAANAYSSTGIAKCVGTETINRRNYSFIVTISVCLAYCDCRKFRQHWQLEGNEGKYCTWKVLEECKHRGRSHPLSNKMRNEKFCSRSVNCRPVNPIGFFGNDYALRLIMAVNACQIYFPLFITVPATSWTIFERVCRRIWAVSFNGILLTAQTCTK